MRALIAMAWASVAALTAQGDTPRTPLAPALVMSPPEGLAEADVQILGGRKVADPEATWPATLKFNGGAGPCTATAIGPHVVLTAAHCVLPNQTGKITVGTVNPFSTTISCQHHPDYDEDVKLDVALCHATAAIRLPGANSAYETVRISEPPRPDTPVVLLGYGCRQELGYGPAGVLFEGDNKIFRITTGDPWIETRGGVAVCSGDSGGGAFVPTGTLRRWMFGVNSQGDLLTRSMITSLADPKVAKFLKDWRRDGRDVKICGIDEMDDCHG